MPTGMGIILIGNFSAAAALANQEPFSAKAYFPVRNWSHDADWLSVMADFGA